jgi:ABC-type sugar transport system substrate-binding protein
MASLKRQLRGQRMASPLAASLVALALGFGVATAHADDDALPKIPNKTPLKVGFAQTESNNPWRLAETKSMKETAAKCGWQLVVTDANGSNAKQVSDIQNMIAQHVDLLVFSVAKPGTDYITFIGSDFINQGQRAADWLVKATNGKAKIIELEGTTGASAANDRKKGFDDVIAKHPDMQIIASQDGDFSRDKGRQVMETLLQAHPDVTAVYAHNDEMALGAIAAIKAAGKQPGKDIQIVTIDGTKGGMDAIAAGELGASVQSSPFFGPLACDVAQKYAKGEKIPTWVKVSDRFYDKGNVQQSMQYGY